VAIPESRADLEALGYVFDNEARCRGCGAAIEWWLTPKGKKMPMSVKEVRETDSPVSPVKEWRRIPHFSDCPKVADFRKGA
jgi:hypothetical protein